MLIQLFDFQSNAAKQIADRFAMYSSSPLVDPFGKPIMFFQTLHSITASGKTAILADAVNRMQVICPEKPIVMWISARKVVVEQTFSNLNKSGKYNHLLGDSEFDSICNFDQRVVSDENNTIVYFATAGSFTQKDKEEGDRLIYRSNIDSMGSSIWESLKERRLSNGNRRPLIVVYDEGHNLSDLQFKILLDLEPQAFITSSATMRFKSETLETKVLSTLRNGGWTDDHLITTVSSKDVVEAGLIKSEIVFGGYQTPMKEAIDDMLVDFYQAETEIKRLSLSNLPKAIYVTDTNVQSDNRLKADDPKVPFDNRKSPSILMWKYLTRVKGIDPSEIVVYANLNVDKEYPLPPEFVLLRGGKNDFEQFKKGSYRHIIFNKTLVEGWDDPYVYFGYIDKTMGSTVEVTQVVGRLLRQPGARRYESNMLNTAHFYVRVDGQGVFKREVDTLINEFSDIGVDVNDDSNIPIITFTKSSNTERPRTLKPNKKMYIPRVAVEQSTAYSIIEDEIKKFTTYYKDSTDTKSKGFRTLFSLNLADGETREKSDTKQQNNMVSARWVLQSEIRRIYSDALSATDSSHVKFDVPIAFGSNAYEHVQKLAKEIVEIYQTKATLFTNDPGVEPCIVGDQTINKESAIYFNNSLHACYDRLNKLEIAFAKEIDKTGLSWARNPSRSGFGIPLITQQITRKFYPDFIVWKDDVVYVLETKGEHLLNDALNTKLLQINTPGGKMQLYVRLISKGKWHWKGKAVQETNEGYTVWSLKNSFGNDGIVQATYVSDIENAVAVSLDL